MDKYPRYFDVKSGGLRRPTTTRMMRRRAFRTRDHVYFRVLDFDKVRGSLTCDRFWHAGPWPASWRGSAIVGYPREMAWEAMAELRQLRKTVLPIGHRSRNLHPGRITMNLPLPCYGWTEMRASDRADFIEYHRR